MVKIDLLRPAFSFGANTYLLSSCGECCVIDPATPYREDYLHGKLKYILLTHCHFDHILEIDSWVNATGAEVLISAEDGNGLSDPEINCYGYFMNISKGFSGKYTVLKDGDFINIGSDTLSVLSCPGHTEGSLSFVSEGVAFVGDTVFAGGGYGRCDLPGGDFQKLKQSIKRIINYPSNTVLYCGHGPKTTVGEYKAAIYF